MLLLGHIIDQITYVVDFDLKAMAGGVAVTGPISIATWSFPDFRVVSTSSTDIRPDNLPLAIIKLM